MTNKFLHFINTLQTKENANLLESIKKGFQAITESYNYNSPKSGRFIIVPKIGEIQSPEKDTVLLPFENILHYDYFVEYILPVYFHLSAENIIKLKQFHQRKNSAYPFRRGVVDVHPHGETDPDRINAVFVQTDNKKLTKENIKEIISWFNLQDVESKIHFRDYGNVNLEMREVFNKMLIEENAEKPTINVDPTQFKTLPALQTFEGVDQSKQPQGNVETRNLSFNEFKNENKFGFKLINKKAGNLMIKTK